VLGRHEVDRDGGEFAFLAQDARGQLQQGFGDGVRQLGAGGLADFDVQDGHVISPVG